MLCLCDTDEKAPPFLSTKPMWVQCWTHTMLFEGVQYQPCVWLQTDSAFPRQESPIENGLYEDHETGKLCPKLIVSDFTDI